MSSPLREVAVDRIHYLIREFFDSRMLNPHGICLLWRPELLFTHAVSDVLIGCAYFSIPLVLAAFLRRRPDVQFSWAVWMFVAFIMLCGMTHFMMVWTLWHPDYGIEALFKAMTATVSVVTAVALWPLLPKAIALPSTADLEARVRERDAALKANAQTMATMVELREHDRQQTVLLNEINHRVKNTLTAVQSLATQTLKSAPDLKVGREMLVERLIALSTIHNLLVERAWDQVLLSDVIGHVVAPYAKPHAVSGADFLLSPNISITLSMVLHELANNALRHGAWLGGGRVSIEISVVEARFDLKWTEQTSTVSPRLDRHGYGLKLLLKSAPRELGGKATIEVTPQTLIYLLSAPLPAAASLAA